MTFFSVTEEQLTVAVFVQDGGSLRRLSGAWLASFEIVADLRSAEQLHEALENVAGNTSNFAQSMGSVFVEHGLELEESQFSVADPVMSAMIETTTMTTARASVTSLPPTPIASAESSMSNRTPTWLIYFLVILVWTGSLLTLVG
jgi:hypothetical protein